MSRYFRSTCHDQIITSPAIAAANGHQHSNPRCYAHAKHMRQPRLPRHCLSQDEEQRTQPKDCKNVPQSKRQKVLLQSCMSVCLSRWCAAWTTSIASIAATRARGIRNEGVLQVANSADIAAMYIAAMCHCKTSLTECLRNSNETHPFSWGVLLPALGPGTIHQVVWTWNVLCCAKHSGNRIRGKDNVTEPKTQKEISQCGNIDKNTHTFEQGAVNAMLLSYVSSEGLSLKGLP